MNQVIYNELIAKNHKLYHITEFDNLSSILKNGLYSLKKIKESNINPKYISSEDSRSIDAYLGLDKYVRLAYTYQYDMLAAAIYNGTLQNPVIICIRPEILLDKINIKYTTMNAISNEAFLYSKNNNFSIDFRKIYTNRSRDTMSEEYKNARQSEILVEECVETSYIAGIVIPSNKEYINTINNIEIMKRDTHDLINGNFK